MPFERLNRIAELIGCPAEAFNEQDASIDTIVEILALWPKLGKQDHKTILSLAQFLASRTSSEHEHAKFAANQPEVP